MVVVVVDAGCGTGGGTREKVGLTEAELFGFTMSELKTLRRSSKTSIVSSTCIDSCAIASSLSSTFSISGSGSVELLTIDADVDGSTVLAVVELDVDVVDASLCSNGATSDVS